MSIERIRKLLSMTVARGCTEAEAMAAAEKAALLMAELGLSPGDVVMEAASNATRYAVTSVRAGLWGTIAVCTNTAWIFVSDVGGDRVEFVGASPGPEVAVYLHTLTGRAIDRELRGFKATPGYRKRTLRNRRRAANEFTQGMVMRLGRRLRELFGSTYSAPALEAAVAERDRRYSQAETVERRPLEIRSRKPLLAGLSAGNNVPLSHGVGAAGVAPMQIERAR